MWQTVLGSALASLWPLPLPVPELSSISVLPPRPSYPLGKLSGCGNISLLTLLPPDPLSPCLANSAF